MYGLLLPLDIKGLSAQEIRIQLFDQICKSQPNLIFFSDSFLISSYLFVECKLNRRNSKRFSNRDYSLSETDPWTLS